MLAVLSLDIRPTHVHSNNGRGVLLVASRRQ